MRLDRYGSIAIACFFLLVFAACEKGESPITKPPKGVSNIARVDMGDDYADQIFFDFASGQSVLVSKINSWDLAFEASPAGYHVFMNGGKDVLLYNTHISNPASVTETNAYMVMPEQWGFDHPNGNPDSTYVGDWRQKNEVYLVKFNDGSFKKFLLSSVNDTAYTFSYGDINATTLTTIALPKNPSFNYTYFLFDGGKITYPEPAKNTYDIVFTRYRHIYYDLDSFKYSVNGVLLNPYNTFATADSSVKFEDITFQTPFVQKPFSADRNIIGFDWKRFNFTTQVYETDANKVYVVKTHSGQYWKLHFLNFYNANGAKGSPTFEFERIQ